MAQARAEKKATEEGPVGCGGTKIWQIPQPELDKYHGVLEKISEEVVDLDAQLVKDKAKLDRRMQMLLVDLAAAANVPIGTPASVQGRYFVEVPEPPSGQQVVRR